VEVRDRDGQVWDGCHRRLDAPSPVDILAVAACRRSFLALPGTTVPALIGVAATVIVQLILGRRSLITVGIGTAIYVALAICLEPRCL
jgi:branched-subunit amino acid transport protein AzlD